MRKRFLEIPLAAAALLSVCAAPSARAEPPNGGTICIVPKAADEDQASLAPFVNAVTEALSTKGFTILDDPDHAAYVAEMILTRAEVGTGAARVATGSASVMPGNAPGVGAGVTIPLSTGKSRLVPIERTRLEIRIRKRGADGVVWDGAAMTVREAGTRRGGIDAVAAALGEASVRSYPIEVRDDVGVP